MNYFKDIYLIFLFILCGAYICPLHCFNQIDHIVHHYITPQTATIYGRFYIIKRIDRVFTLLKEKSIVRQLTYTNIAPQYYQHTLVQAAAVKMRDQQQITPLYDLWYACTRYQQLYDSTFEREFVHLVHALCSEFTGMPFKHHIVLDNVHEQLRALDAHLDGYLLGYKYIHRQESFDDVPTTDLIAQRYLVLKRLNKSFYLLQQLYKRNVHIDTATQQKNSFFLDVEQLHNSRVREAIQQMYIKKNLEPLLYLADDVEQYRFIGDETFLQEMLMNLFVVYKGLLLKAHNDKEGEVIVEQMTEVLTIYENIAELPLDETLEAIDMVTDRLLALQYMDKKEFNLKKLLAPLIGGSICLLAAVYTYITW